MTAIIPLRPRASPSAAGAFPAAFGSAVGPGFHWGVPAGPARPFPAAARPLRSATDVVQPMRQTRH
ncbi:hypothetical protein D3218_17925 [Aureimonas flava]|uniref:Uncharacterized protein n=1 Tax=Aureimonas flava TaxID=2320271 RepID=A0A3A1WP93_9HYPH|nr:hypothetical protein [Aureimonas flava]RIX97961.1 hypothetical protein D3218_17925 [Aureimonas flava]